MNNERRVVITGIGVVSPIGIGKKAFWNGLVEGKSGAKKISSFDASTYPTQVAGEIPDFDPGQFISHKELRRMDRSSQMILAAALMAVDDANLKFDMDMAKVGVFTGTAIGGQAWAFREYDIFREKGIRRINPFTAIATFPNASSAQIAFRFGCKGPSDTISSGCVSSAVALGYALDNLRRGTVDIALVGGTEAPLDSGIFGAYCAAHVMTPEVGMPCRVPRPFDSARNGIVLSEGAAVLVCETLERASTRRARAYAEIAGWCHNSDCYSMMMLNPNGLQAKAVMKGALADSGSCAEEIDYIQAHAPGTVVDDIVEATAVQELFEPRINSIPVVSIKSMIGHTQGASGVIETAAAALSTYKGVVPRSINCDVVDPRCLLRINSYKPMHISIHSVLMNNFGFGGKNASIVLRSVS
jgi:3-oxoacyl-[acyl-carrier-protein] synthase II